MSAALRALAHKSILELETEEGILASARHEAYGCIFGRDSLVTSMALLRTYESTGDSTYLAIVKKTLSTLASLQGSEINLESGEEPGKCIHEFRPDNHEHLTGARERPWYVYPDSMMRNYDTVDATPLFLMTVHKLVSVDSGAAYIERMLPHVRRALSWILEYGDSNNDGFVDYQFNPKRQSGGLSVQSWMDSSESVFFESNGEKPEYPIAPVEVQAYTYAALRAWSDFFAAPEPEFSNILSHRANLLKDYFNRSFVKKRGSHIMFAFAIDGQGRALWSPRSSIGHCLWAAAPTAVFPYFDSILNDEYHDALVKRLFAKDLFVPRAGFRTLSSRSSRFSPISYHNGSIWPHDTAILAEGLANFGYAEEASAARSAIIQAWTHFRTPIELFGYTRGNFCEYKGEDGRGACRVQAWSAASLLAILARS